MTIKIVTDKKGKLRLQVIPNNSKIPMITSTKGLTSENIDRHIKILQSGEYFAEIETANKKIAGVALYFTVYSEDGEKIGISKIYHATNGLNPRNSFTRAENTCLRSIESLKKYTNKVIE